MSGTAIRTIDQIRAGINKVKMEVHQEYCSAYIQMSANGFDCFGCCDCCEFQGNTADMLCAKSPEANKKKCAGVWVFQILKCQRSEIHFQ